MPTAEPGREMEAVPLRVRRPRRRRPGRPGWPSPLTLVAISGVALSGALAAGCGGSSVAAGPSCTPPSTVIAGRSVRIPTQPGCVLISPGVASGDQVLITATGLRPAHLLGGVKVPITFTNLTDQPQQLTFEYSSVRSPVIAPGGTWTWTPKTGISVAYDSPSGLHGLLDIGAFP